MARANNAAAIAQDASVTAANALLALQTQIAAYLSVRNLAPFVQADFGAGQAIGGGEPAALLVLREYESDPTYYTPSELCTEPPRVGWRLRCFDFRFDYSMTLAH